MKIRTFKEMQTKLPNRIIEKAVKGMLPKGKLGRQIYKNLRVYDTDTHPHVAQNPIFLEL